MPHFSHNTICDQSATDPHAAPEFCARCKGLIVVVILEHLLASVKDDRNSPESRASHASAMAALTHDKPSLALLARQCWERIGLTSAAQLSLRTTIALGRDQVIPAIASRLVSVLDEMTMDEPGQTWQDIVAPALAGEEWTTHPEGAWAFVSSCSDHPPAASDHEPQSPDRPGSKAAVDHAQVKASATPAPKPTLPHGGEGTSHPLPPSPGTAHDTADPARSDGGAGGPGPLDQIQERTRQRHRQFRALQEWEEAKASGRLRRSPGYASFHLAYTELEEHKAGLLARIAAGDPGCMEAWDTAHGAVAQVLTDLDIIAAEPASEENK
ncbi:hypothetical protein NLU13_8696 [Sarocladium strictum]|uniref:Uncharacterized protein n=1 Tax=Sarocladium strictum TaxID=5046 RepID=A0AA39GC61_SARSR|nr:hypothetical protein NLU13_8696 [Sarocladium strictum]